MVALNLVYIYGKTFGPDPVMKQPAYTPVFSGARVMDFQRGSLSDLLCWPGGLELPGAAVVWALITYLAWRKRTPLLRFCWVFVIVTPLPIEFLVGRFQGCLYVPMAGWAVLAGAVFMDIARAVSVFAAREPLFRILGRNGILAASVAGAALLLFQEARYRKETFINPAAAAQGPRTRDVIRQLEVLRPHVRPHDRIVFLHDPFTDWDMLFIAELFFRDRTLDIHVQRLNPLPAGDFQTANSVFDFRDGRLIQLK